MFTLEHIFFVLFVVIVSSIAIGVSIIAAIVISPFIFIEIVKNNAIGLWNQFLVHVEKEKKKQIDGKLYDNELQRQYADVLRQTDQYEELEQFMYLCKEYTTPSNNGKTNSFEDLYYVIQKNDTQVNDNFTAISDLFKNNIKYQIARKKYSNDN